MINALRSLMNFVRIFKDEMGSPTKMMSKGFILSPRNSLPRGGGWHGAFEIIFFCFIMKHLLFNYIFVRNCLESFDLLGITIFD